MRTSFTYLLYAASLLTCLGTGRATAQPVVYCDYPDAWKIESIESPAESPYMELLKCNFFISPDGHIGCFNAADNEIYCECCWKRKEDVLMVPDNGKKKKFRIIAWNDHLILLSPADEKGTIITLRKN